MSLSPWIFPIGYYPRTHTYLLEIKWVWLWHSSLGWGVCSLGNIVTSKWTPCYGNQLKALTAASLKEWFIQKKEKSVICSCWNRSKQEQAAKLISYSQITVPSVIALKYYLCFCIFKLYRWYQDMAGFISNSNGSCMSCNQTCHIKFEYVQMRLESYSGRGRISVKSG